MTSVLPTELLRRAEEAIQRSRTLCADTRRLFEEVRERIARVGEADRKLEAALYSTREAKAAALVARFRSLENRLPTAANVNTLPEDIRRWGDLEAEPARRQLAAARAKELSLGVPTTLRPAQRPQEPLGVRSVPHRKSTELQEGVRRFTGTKRAPSPSGS